jgi:hypothetical protein
MTKLTRAIPITSLCLTLHHTQSGQVRSSIFMNKYIQHLQLYTICVIQYTPTKESIFYILWMTK